MLRRKTHGSWTDEHRSVMRKLLVEGDGCRKECTTLVGRTKRSVGAVNRRRQKNTGCAHCPFWRDLRNEIPESLWKWEHRAKTSKEAWKWQRGITTHILSGSNGRKSHLSEGGSPKSTGAGACQSKASGTMSPMARCCGSQVSCVARSRGGDWDQCVGTYGTLEADLEVTAHN